MNKIKKPYCICTRCIMDTTDSDISFDHNGFCNNCRAYYDRISKEAFYNDSGRERLDRLIKQIKLEGKDKKYDCLVGVSGGADSTITAFWAKKLGLRPLAVHVDNGWNSELSVSNIERILGGLGIDLYTHVIDWEEFKDLHLSFLKASVINSEIPTDHALIAFLYYKAAQEGLRYILTGSNIATEAIAPKSWWGHDQNDWKHIKAIHRIFGRVELKTFPHINFFEWTYYIFIKRIKWVPLMNYIPYNKKAAIEVLEKEIGWRPYGAKHYESVYTRFYQAYILPGKFNVDKRRGYLSALVCSGEMTRDEALAEMSRPVCAPDQLKDDKEYVLRKLGLKEEEFEEIMQQPIKSHYDYPSNRLLFEKFGFVVKLAKKITKSL